MTKRIRGRMTAGLLLSFVILFASLGFGATYAWFTSTARSEPSLFVPGAAIADDAGQRCLELDFGCYNFTEGYVSRQEDLAAAASGALSAGEQGDAVTGNEIQAGLNAVFSAWWQSDGPIGESLFEKTDYPAAGQVFVKRYSYVNDTGIPVYIRMKPVVAGFDAASFGWVSDWDGEDAGQWSFDPDADSALVYGGPDGEGYFYLERPLNPGEEILVSFSFYSMAAAGTELSVDMTLEAIQARNNAPYLEASWKKAFDDGFVNYIPYIS